MSRMLLRAAQVLTMGDEPPIPGGAVRIVDDRIVEVGAASALPRLDDEVVYEIGGTLMPGLIDCHEHLNGRDRFAIGDLSVHEPDVMYAYVAAHHATRLLNEGITTARVPGSPGHVDLHLRRAIEEGYLEGPRLICAGRHLTMTGGHGHVHGIEVDGPAEATKAARAQIAAGADFIKLVASGGVGITRPGERPSQPELTVVEMSAIVSVAHSAGKRVTAHADGEEGIGNALQAGVDCVEHGIYLTPDQASYMAAHDVHLVPTLSTMVGIFEHGGDWGMPPDWIPIAGAVLDPHRASFQAALEAGVVFGAGTDGFGQIVGEIEQFASFGLSAYRAMQAATRDAATIIGPAAEDRGVLKPGSLADIIGMPGDPLTDLGALRDMHFVMVGGRPVRDGTHS